MNQRDRSPRRDSRPPRDDRPDDGTRLSRFLALVLRHRAYQFGLDVDEEGYVDIDDLLDLVEEESRLEGIEIEDLEKLTVPNPRQRFQIQDGRIRATYGHSFSRPVRYPSVEPPEHLYYGMPRSKVSHARENGLKPSGRQYVHLSETREEAEEIGRNHDPEALVVTVQAGRAHNAGIAFHRPADGLFLAASVPPEYLELAVSFGRPGRRARRRGR